MNADPEAVFDAIAHVEDFTRYTRLITEIKPLGPALYRWKVQIDGIPLLWDAAVTEYDRPRRFGWQSVRGTYNRGVYHLQPTASGGTKVSFFMEYRLTDTLLERIIAPLAQSVVRKLASEILQGIKERLESKQRSSPDAYD